jgi:hypothetical protein
MKNLFNIMAWAALCLAASGCAGSSTVKTSTPEDEATRVIRNEGGTTAEATPAPPQGEASPSSLDSAAASGTSGTRPTELQGTNIKFTGGDGLSIEDAIVIEGAANESEGVGAEYAYLSLVFGPQGSGWNLVSQSLLEDKGRAYDAMEIETRGATETYYFDITSFFGKW